MNLIELQRQLKQFDLLFVPTRLVHDGSKDKNYEAFYRGWIQSQINETSVFMFRTDTDIPQNFYAYLREFPAGIMKVDRMLPIPPGEDIYKTQRLYVVGDKVTYVGKTPLLWAVSEAEVKPLFDTPLLSAYSELFETQLQVYKDRFVDVKAKGAIPEHLNVIDCVVWQDRVKILHIRES